MGDIVQEKLEAMVGEFEDYRKFSIFTPEEIRNIVKKRENFEYSIVKPTKQKDDYLAYLKYEADLQRLRDLRMMRQEINHKVFSRKHNNIDKVFRRAIAKYRNDKRLWLQYIDYCLKHEHGNPRIISVLESALNACPLYHPFYIFTANWYLQFNSAIEARKILQRGIRVLENNPDLYLELCRLELITMDRAKESEMDNLLDDPITKGELVNVVCRNTLKVFPDDLSIRIKLVNLLQLFDGTTEMVNELYDGIERDFVDEPSAISFMCQKEFLRDRNNTANYNSVIETYNEKLKDYPSEELIRQFLTFLEEYVDHNQQKVSETALKSITQIQNQFEEYLSEINILKIASLLLKYNPSNVDMCIKTLMKSVELYPKSPTSWSQLVSFIQYFKNEEFENYVRKSIKAIGFDKSLSMYESLLDKLIRENKPWEVIFNAYKESMQATPIYKETQEFKLRFLKFLIENKIGKDNIYQVINLTIQYPPNLESYYTVSIHFLAGLPNPNTDHIRQLFIDASNIFGKHSHQIWLDWILWERSVSNFNAANNLYWQAKKTLTTPEEFINRHLSADFNSKILK